MEVENNMEVVKMDIQKFEQVIKLRDGEVITIRALRKNEDDETALIGFFQDLDTQSAKYLVSDFKRISTVKKWIEEIDYLKNILLVALHKDEVVGCVMMSRSNEENRYHVAKIVVILDENFRGRGLGYALSSACEKIAKSIGITKIKAEIPILNVYAIRRARLWGYEKEATLEKEFKYDETYYDIIVFSKFLEEEKIPVPEVIEEFL